MPFPAFRFCTKARLSKIAPWRSALGSSSHSHLLYGGGLWILLQIERPIRIFAISTGDLPLTFVLFVDIFESDIAGYTFETFGLFVKPGGDRKPLLHPALFARKVFPIHLFPALSDSYVPETIARIVDI